MAKTTKNTNQKSNDKNITFNITKANNFLAYKKTLRDKEKKTNNPREKWAEGMNK